MKTRRIADLLREIGRENSKGGQDAMLAHITPEEAALLRRRGGSGRIDPVTGLPHFEDGDTGNEGQSDASYGSSGDSSTGENNSSSSYSDSANDGPDGEFGWSGDPSNPNEGTGYSFSQFGWAPDEQSGYWTSPNADQGFGNIYGAPDQNGPAESGNGWDSPYNPANDLQEEFDANQGNRGLSDTFDVVTQETPSDWDSEFSSRGADQGSVWGFSNTGPDGLSEEEFTAQQNLGGFQNSKEGLTRADLEKAGVDWGADRGIGAAINDARGWNVGMQQYSRDNPVFNAAMQYGVPALGYAVGPIGSLLAGGLSSLARGDTPSLAGVAGYLGGPNAALATSLIENGVQGNWGNVAGSAINAGLNAAGSPISSWAAEQGGRAGGITGSAIGGLLGNYAQSALVSSALDALGIENGMSLGGTAAGQSFDASPSSDSMVQAFSSAYDYPSADFSSAPASTSAYAPSWVGGIGGGGGADIGSSYLQKIKDLYKNQTGANEIQRRKTWYSDASGSPWEVIK